MLAYLIDPLDKTIAVVSHDESMLEICRMLMCRGWIIVQRSGLYKGDTLYLDENYRQRPLIPRHGLFSFKGVVGFIPGRALISGHTDDGEMCDPKTPMKRIRELVSWG